MFLNHHQFIFCNYHYHSFDFFGLDFLFLSLFWFAVNLAGGWWRLGGGGVVGDVSSELLRHGGIRPRVILPHISEQNRNDINNLNYFFLSSGWGGGGGGVESGR